MQLTAISLGAHIHVRVVSHLYSYITYDTHEQLGIVKAHEIGQTGQFLYAHSLQCMYSLFLCEILNQML